ncbi:hypothetical protein GA0115234_107669 [Streptomyces sp. DvalAA-43]|nr:hypothetical protein GA0115234_107669 [Streptomyces sp. DvalAA-43]
MEEAGDHRPDGRQQVADGLRHRGQPAGQGRVLGGSSGWTNSRSRSDSSFGRIVRTAQAKADTAGNINWLVSVDSTIV